MARFHIQRMTRNGDWDNIFRGDFTTLEEAKMYADVWSRKDSTCAWGVQVIDTYAADAVVYEP